MTPALPQRASRPRSDLTPRARTDGAGLRTITTLLPPAGQSCGCSSATPTPCPRCAAQAWSSVPVGPPDGPLEAEAEGVASRIDRLPAPHAAGVAGAAGASDTAGAAALTPRPLSGAPVALRDALAGGGQALDGGTRRHFEGALGHDFSAVRVHADARAGASARALSSRAFTWGQHIAFAPGQYAPHSAGGRHLLAHELVHVVQQAGRPAGARSKANNPDDYTDVQTAGGGPRLQRTPDFSVSAGVLAHHPIVQRDFALEPPRPDAVGRVLNAAEMATAIAYDERVVAVIGADGLAELRDVLGLERQPALVDEDFVRGVLDWQAVQGLTQDGQLGPASAGRLFLEIGAEDVGRAELASGPSYRAVMSLTPPVDGAGQQNTGFHFNAEFQNDPVNGIFASCGEVHQFIQWDAASAAALPLGRPHTGFPAGTGAGTWIEDRDRANTRYGHRRGPFSALGTGDEYIDTTGHRNAAFGHIYRGRDFPGGPAAILAGHWSFFVRAYDVCNGNKVLGTDYLRITW